MKNQILSVLMTAYNAENYIHESISSIINQSFKNWILILVDDKSEDNTVKIVKSFNNKKIKIYKLKKNIGRTNALNYGLKKCKTKYTAILDADDISSTHRLKKQIYFLEKNKKFQMVGSWAHLIDSAGKKIGSKKTDRDFTKMTNSLKLINYIPHSSITYSTSFAKKLGGYPSHLKYAQDFALILKFLKEKKINVIPEYLVKCRFTENSMTFSKKYEQTITNDGIKLLRFSKKNFYFTKFQLIKYYYLITKFYIKLIRTYLKEKI